MKKLKSKKGITLVALIITIIVMVILAGIIIVSAVADGGIIDRAQDAIKENERAELQDLIIASYIYEKVASTEKVYVKLNLESTAEAICANLISNGFKLPDAIDKTDENGETVKTLKVENNKIDLNIQGKHENYTGTVTEKGLEGDIRIGKKVSTKEFKWSSVGLTVDTNTEYISEEGLTLNFSVDGKLVMSANGMVMATVDATNSDNIDETTGNLSFDIEIEGTPTNVVVTMNTNNVDIDAVLEEMGTFNFVKIVVDNITVYSNEEVLKRLGITNYIGTYTGTWKKIGEENGKIKLVSTRVVANCELGFENPKATGADNLEKSIWSYKNAVNTLNTVAQEATGIASAESIAIEDIYSIIGEENVNKGDTYGRVYNYYYNNDEQKVYSKYKTGTNDNGEIIWSDPYNTGYSSQTFVDDDGNTVVVDSENDKVTLTNTVYDYDLTEDQKEQIGALASGYYWLASPCVCCDSNGAHFFVRCMSSGNIRSNDLFDSDDLSRSSYSSGVRAVVSISDL